jgi:hypothetical protein
MRASWAISVGGHRDQRLGSAGLLSFSDIGEKVWEYPQEASETISHCYALNVSGSEAAIFF